VAHVGLTPVLVVLVNELRKEGACSQIFLKISTGDGSEETRTFVLKFMKAEQTEGMRSSGGRLRLLVGKVMCPRSNPKLRLLALMTHQILDLIKNKMR
jgi:hypothetical protein